MYTTMRKLIEQLERLPGKLKNILGQRDPTGSSTSSGGDVPTLITAPTIPDNVADPGLVSHPSEKADAQDLHQSPERDPTATEQVVFTERRNTAISSSEPHQPDFTWKVLKEQVAVLDDTSDISQLRWIDEEFIYFIDIPWDYKLEGHLNSSKELSTWSVTIGLLEDIMDMKIPEDFLLDHDQRILLADRLSRLIVPWARELLRSSQPRSTDPTLPSSQRGEYNLQLFRRVTNALDDAVYSRSGSLLEDGADSDMICSLVVMLSSIESCIQAVWKLPKVGDTIVNHTRMFGEVTQILRRKISKDWGHQESFEMERLFSGGIPFAAFAITRPPTLNNVMKVDTKNYQQKHVTPDCTCSFIGPSLSDVCKFVADKKVPVIVFDGTNIRVSTARDTPYVAISHVWADGLGSTTEVGLPNCQVQRLARLAGQLVSSGGFWQDGLCIPEEKESRNRAIALMAETYTSAEKVLVLDEGIRSSCQQSTPKEECLLRIATSGWMQRIWTLQEGMLACELHFELQDNIIDPTHFNNYSFSLARRLIPLLGYRGRDLQTRKFEPRLQQPPKCTVNDLIGLLRYRTTSKPRDEPVAISGLLRIDASTLVHIESGEERMKSLLIQVGEVPRKLAVFGWYCFRLHIDNFGWAPTSISDVLWPDEPEDPIKAICTQDGLFSKFTVVRFSERIKLQEFIGIILILEENGQGNHKGNNSMVFNVVLSFHFFRRESTTETLTVDGFLFKEATLEDSIRDEGVGTVTFEDGMPQVPDPSDGSSALTCKFVAPASLRYGLPDKIVTARSLPYWKVVHATVEPLKKVRVV